MSYFISCYRQTVQVKNPISTPALASQDLIYNLRFSRELVGDKWSYCRAGKWVILPSQMLHSQQSPCVKWYTVLPYICVAVTDSWSHCVVLWTGEMTHCIVAFLLLAQLVSYTPATGSYIHFKTLKFYLASLYVRYQVH